MPLFTEGCEWCQYFRDVDFQERAERFVWKAGDLIITKPSKKNLPITSIPKNKKPNN